MKIKSIYIVVFLFGALVYINTIPNKYAYDDYSVIQDNKFTKQGLQGIPGHLLNDSFFGFTGQKNLFRGGRYRPLSLITFSIEHEYSGGNPHVSHLINVILFGLICMLLLKVFTTLFHDKLVFSRFQDYFLSLSLMSTLIFAVHPIHTEVVANIKGRDELMALLFGLLSWNFSLKYAERSKIRDVVFAGLFFFLSLLSKESSAPLLVLIPLSIFCFKTRKNSRKVIFATSIGLAGGFILFMLLRQSVLGWSTKPSMPDNILSNAYMYANGFSERYGTTFYTLGLYLKLLLLPINLTIDYYPFYIAYNGLSSWKAILPIVLYLGLTVGAVFFTYRKNIAGYGFLFYLVALLPVSNLLFSIGPFLGERFAFIPSVGFILAIVWLILAAMAKFKLQNAAVYFFVPLLLLLGIKTISRNFDWKDNFTLYTTDVQISKNSAIITRFAGQELLTRLETEKDTQKVKKYVKLAIEYLEQAAKLNRSTTETFLLGNAYFNDRQFERAISMYAETLKMNQGYVKAYANYLIAVEQLVPPQMKIQYYNELLSIAGERYDPYYKKAFVFGKQLNNIDSALVNLNRAYVFDSNRVECLSALGIVYAMKGDYKKSALYLEKGYKIDPNDPNIVNNLIVTLSNLGDKERVKSLTGSRPDKH